MCRINLSYILIVNERFLLQKGIDTVFFYVYNQTILFVGRFSAVETSLRLKLKTKFSEENYGKSAT